MEIDDVIPVSNMTSESAYPVKISSISTISLDLFLASSTAKFYWINRDCFSIDKGIIWRTDPKTNLIQLVVPRNCREDVLQLSHNVPLAGHQGEDRTLSKIKVIYVLAPDVKGCTKICGKLSYL